ncbi:MAG: hypothetical protein IPH49_10935 [Ignavibacteria bacterium]|nr:hypothetical protein [Ignavibacteria bacterium]
MESHDINGVGDSFTVKANERFVLDLKKPIDLASQSVQISEISNEAGGKLFEVSIVEACRPKIVLSRKCQKVYWYNPYRIPEVITPNHASDSLIKDQIIMTPLIGNDKDILGYELRVGDHMECPSVAYRRWKKYKNQIRGARANNVKNAAPIARLGETSAEPS